MGTPGYDHQQRWYQLIENFDVSQPAFTCSKSKTETLEQGMEYVQS